MDFKPTAKRALAKVRRSANTLKKDLNYLCTSFDKIDLVKPVDLTHNKREKDRPTSAMADNVAHTKTQISGLRDGSIRKSSNKARKARRENFVSRASTISTVKNSYPANSGKNRRKSCVKVVHAEACDAKSQVHGGSRTKPTRDLGMFTHDPRKGYRHICLECKRMYKFQINLLNHDIVDHHLDRAYCQLPSFRAYPSSRRTTELELINQAILGGDASSTINHLGTPEQWIHGDLTILNVQWARYLFNDQWTEKICVDSGMKFEEVKDTIKRLDELEGIDREEFEREREGEDNEIFMKRGPEWWDAKSMKDQLSKRDFSLWKAAVVDNELVEGMEKMMKGSGSYCKF